MRFSVITVLPELIEGSLGAGVVGRAREKKIIQISTVNPRDFTRDKHRTVDDTPYGGGPGMVMKVEPVVEAIEAAVASADAAPDGADAAGAVGAHRVLLTPTGRPLTQAVVRELATHRHLVLVCGRYEGIDERVAELAIDDAISLGDFVLSGGELAALTIIDAVSRLVPGVLGEPTSADDESFAAGLLEYPQYTRPVEYRGRGVPEVLSSGNHAAIAKWRRGQALRRTAISRPDLLGRSAAHREQLFAAEPAFDVAARTSVALVHHPVLDAAGDLVTSAVTNLDLHDIARSAMTYGLASYFVVTPVTSQREKVEHIATAWRDAGRDHRIEPLSLVRSVPAVADAIAAVFAERGQRPLVVATSARADAFPAAARHTPGSLLSMALVDPRPLLLLFGTGWGMVDEKIPQVDVLLAPIEGRRGWNHLSVRSAVAVLLDRLFGAGYGSS